MNAGLLDKIIVAVLGAAIIGISGYLLSLNTRVVAIEASRYTSQDARTFEVSVTDKFNTIMLGIEKTRNEFTLALEKLRAKVPDEAPPKWFVDRVDSIEKRVDRLEKGGK